tara:strand:- start:111 stop:2297 length:2187 start_codon:yes stop_codon:yes gene_type:complete
MTGYKPPYLAGTLISITVFALYYVTLAPTTSWWDASEYIATGHILGIPHPPGNPLFVSLARTWSVLIAPLGFSVAFRINLLAAITSATATFFFFMINYRILSVVLEKRWMAILGSASGALIGATAYTVWNQSNVNEKVYTVSVAIIAASSWLLIRWYDNQDRHLNLKILLVAIYAMVLGSTNHLMSLFPLPAFGVFMILVCPAILLSWRFWIRMIPLVALGLSFNLFLPIRAAQDPIINEGDPICESAVGAVVAIYTNGNTGCPALASSLSREQYAKPPMVDRQAPFWHQLLNYSQYFDWQWARGLEGEPPLVGGRFPITLLFLSMGLMGLIVIWRADRNIFAYLTVLILTLTFGLVVYLNFKYGFSLASYITDRSAHEVRERDYFFVAGFILWGNLVGIGLTGFWAALSDRWGGERAYLKTIPMFVVVFIPLIFNWSWADRSGDYAARDWAYDLLMSVEPYGILFTNGDNDTFPLWYLQEVEGVRKDVSVVVVQYLYTDWYPKQLRDMTDPSRQRSFSEEFSFGVYPVTPIPESAITDSEDDILDAVGSGPIPKDLPLSLGDVVVTYPEGLYLNRGHRLALSFIYDSIDERPIYFASSAGLLEDLGLRDWGVRHGLATKLVMRDLNENRPEGLVRGSDQMGAEWFDMDRNLFLVRDVYQYRGIRNREIWQDRSTLNIPLHYQALFVQLADAAAIAELSTDEVDELIQNAVAFRTTALGGSRYLSLGR